MATYVVANDTNSRRRQSSQVILLSPEEILGLVDAVDEDEDNETEAKVAIIELAATSTTMSVRVTSQQRHRRSGPSPTDLNESPQQPRRVSWNGEAMISSDDQGIISDNIGLYDDGIVDSKDDKYGDDVSDDDSMTTNAPNPPSRETKNDLKTRSHYWNSLNDQPRDILQATRKNTNTNTYHSTDYPMNARALPPAGIIDNPVFRPIDADRERGKQYQETTNRSCENSKCYYDYHSNSRTLFDSTRTSSRHSNSNANNHKQRATSSRFEIFQQTTGLIF